MTQPTVSVVIPTFNRAGLIGRAIESVIAQVYQDWEIIVVDDGSTDETAAVVRGFAGRLGKRLSYIRQRNAGSSAARNRGIDESRGAFVAFLDSDDEYLPDKLALQLHLFELRPELGLVFGDYAFVGGDGVRHESALAAAGSIALTLPNETVSADLHVCPADFFEYLLSEYFIATIVGMVRRDVLGDSIRFPEGLGYAEEWLFYLRVAHVCRAGFVSRPLCIHHHVMGSLARTDPQRNTLRLRDLLLETLRSFPELTRRQRRLVRANLARTCRQSGYDAHRSGHYASAARFFIESFRCQAAIGSVWDAGHSAILSWKQGASRGRADKANVQGSAESVR